MAPAVNSPFAPCSCLELDYDGIRVVYPNTTFGPSFGTEAEVCQRCHPEAVWLEGEDDPAPTSPPHPDVNQENIEALGFINGNEEDDEIYNNDIANTKEKIQQTPPQPSSPSEVQDESTVGDDDEPVVIIDQPRDDDFFHILPLKQNLRNVNIIPSHVSQTVGRHHLSRYTLRRSISKRKATYATRLKHDDDDIKRKDALLNEMQTRKELIKTMESSQKGAEQTRINDLQSQVRAISDRLDDNDTKSCIREQLKLLDEIDELIKSDAICYSIPNIQNPLDYEELTTLSTFGLFQRDTTIPIDTIHDQIIKSINSAHLNDLAAHASEYRPYNVEYARLNPTPHHRYIIQYLDNAKNRSCYGYNDLSVYPTTTHKI